MPLRMYSGLLDNTGRVISPEEQAQASEGFLYSMQGLPLAGASLLPPVALGQSASDPKNWVPGAASYLGAGVESLAELGIDKIAKPIVRWAQQTNPAVAAVTPQVSDAPTVLPGHEALQGMNENAVRSALAAVPHFEAKTEAAKLGQDIGIGLGQAAFTASPELAGPAWVRAALNTVSVPRSALPIAGGLGAVGGAMGPEGAAVGQQDAPASMPNMFPSAADAPTTVAAKITTTDGPPSIPNMFPPPTPPLRPNYGQPDPNNDSGIPGWMYYGGLAAGAAGLWAAAKYGPRTINTIADVVKGVERDPAAVTAALNSPMRAVSGGSPIEMPLPNDASGLTRQWATNAYNPNAVLNELAKAPAMAATPAAADARIAANELINNPANANRRMEGLFRTGTEEGTGHQFPKIIDYKGAVDALSPAEQDLFNQAAWFKSELNLRNQKIQEAAGNGVMWTPQTDQDYRVSFRNNPTDAPTGAAPGLRQVVDLAEQNPKIKALLDQNKDIQSSIVDSYEKRGLITPAQADYARKWYPDFMPTIDASGNYMHSWDAKLRDVNSGYNTPPTSASDAMIKHFGTSIQQAQLKDWQRDWILHIYKQQRADPSLGEIVTERRTPLQVNSTIPSVQVKDTTKPAGGSLDRSITIQTSAGPRIFDINNSALWRNLGGGPQQTNISAGIANIARLSTQSATTGLASTLFGAPFAIKTAIRDLGLIPAQAPRGMWRGSLDKMLDTRLPYDPTMISGTARTLAGDASSVITKNVADMMGNRSNVVGASLRKYYGDAQVDAWTDWMRAHYEASNLAKREAIGVGAGGNRALLNMQPGASDMSGTIRDPTAGAVSPLLNRPNFQGIPDRVPLPNFARDTINGVVKGTAESAINLHTLARELYGVIADAPHSYIHDLNISNPRYTPRTLATAVQGVTGNPGTRGMGVWTQRLSKNVPFYNTTIQALGGSLRAVRDNPIQTGTTIATVLATTALAEHLSALLSGPEHTKFLEDKLSNSTQARNATIFHGPGTDPTNHTELPFPNEWQWLWPAFSGVTGHAIGTWNAHSDEDGLSRLIHTLAGVFDNHVTTDTVKQTGIGAVSAFVPVDTPPLISGAVAGLTGQETRNLPDTLVSNALSGKPLLSGMTSGGGPTHNVPGQEGTDGVLTRANSGTLKAVMSSLGGAFGAAYDMAHNFNQRSKVDPAWAWEGLWRDYKQQWQDNTRYANSIWQNNLPQSTFGPMEERTSGMWRNVAATANVSSDIRGEGFSGVKRGAPLLKAGDSPVPQDPVMRNLYMATAEVGKGISRDLMPRENEIRAQIDNLKSSPFMPEEKRRIGNKLSDQLYDVIAQKHKMLLDLNARLSQLAGGRHVDTGGRINWQGTVDQFHY